jgi:uncharacterized protein
MRLLSSWQQYLATSHDTGLQIHQYASADIDADLAGGSVRVSMRSDYPREGRVTVHIVATPDEAWVLSLRVPGWCVSGTVTDPTGTRAVAGDTGAVVIERRWSIGDVVVLDLDMPVRVTEPDPRVDAVRGCVAVERGPLVYCVESADLPPAVELEDLVWDASREPVAAPRTDLGVPVVGVDVPLRRRDGSDGALTVAAIPYHTWANRRVAGMRVWLPRT